MFTLIYPFRHVTTVFFTHVISESILVAGWYICWLFDNYFPAALFLTLMGAFVAFDDKSELLVRSNRERTVFLGTNTYAFIPLHFDRTVQNAVSAVHRYAAVRIVLAYYCVADHADTVLSVYPHAGAAVVPYLASYDPSRRSCNMHPKSANTFDLSVVQPDDEPRSHNPSPAPLPDRVRCSMKTFRAPPEI